MVLLLGVLFCIQFHTAGQSIHLMRCKTFYQMENYEALMDPALKAVKAEPESGWANFYLAAAYIYILDTVNASLYIDKAISLADEEMFPIFLETRFNYHFMLEKYSKALEDLILMESKIPITYYQHYNYGACYDNMGDTNKAIMYYRKALIGGSHNADLLKDYGRQMLLKGDVDSAEIMFRKSLLVNPDNLAAFMCLAQVDVMRHDVEKMVQKTDSVFKLIHENITDSALAEQFIFEVLIFRYASEIYFNRMDLIDKDLTALKWESPVLKQTNVLYKLTKLMIEKNLTETEKELSKLPDSVTYTNYGISQIRFILDIHNRNVKSFGQHLILWLQHNQDDSQTLYEKLTVKPYQEVTIIENDIVYSRMMASGEISIMMSVIPDKDYLLEVEKYINTINTSNKSSVHSIQASQVVHRFYEFWMQ